MTTNKFKEMKKEHFSLMLQTKYNGSIIPISRYSNHQTTMIFQCDQCHTRFFARPDYLLGAKNGQTHKCFTNYGSVRSSFRDKPNNTQTKLSMKRENEILNLFNKGMDLYEIAERLKLQSYSVYTVLFEEGLVK